MMLVVTNHVVGTLEAIGLDQLYQREYLLGCIMDGQYIHLMFPDDLKWDPAHRIGLSIKDSYSKSNRRQSFIENISDTIQTTMKLLSYGKPYGIT